MTISALRGQYGAQVAPARDLPGGRRPSPVLGAVMTRSALLRGYLLRDRLALPATFAWERG
jgi:hypothetical protein